MQKPTFKNKLFARRRAFTLIELLIVIAIIGILFIVLISKVDFATDKAKATGVQTDFRSFQMAFDTVAKENAGFNTFGWDTGDTNANGTRDSYDEGDTNKNGIQNGTEVFTGHKVYTETFTKVYSLVKPGTTGYDRDALNRLETAINANLDPKLHITIADDGTITMANGAQDPWDKEYHGAYITNAEVDKKDRGAIIMYSDGANNEFGSEHQIANGVVSISIPGNNKFGKDDYSLVSLYTYINGYGEVKNITTGFSNNQTMLGGNGVDNNNNLPVKPETPVEPDTPDEPTPTNPYENLAAGLYETGSNFTVLTKSYDQMIQEGIASSDGHMLKKDDVIGDLVLPDTVTMLIQSSISNCPNLTGLYVPSSVQRFTSGWLNNCSNLKTLILHPVNDIGALSGTTLDTIYFLGDMKQWCNIVMQNFPAGVTKLYIDGELITEMNFENYPEITEIKGAAFEGYKGLTKVILSEQVDINAADVFNGCTNLSYIEIDTVLDATTTFQGCTGINELYVNKPLNSIFAFWGAKINTLYLDKDCTKLGNSTFVASGDIQTVYYEGTVEDWALIDFYNSNDSNPFYLGATIYFNNEIVENPVFENITEIKPYAFCFNNFKTVTIGSNVKKIGSNAFWASKSNTEFYLNEGLEVIELGALGGNNGIILKYLPTTLVDIQERAFMNCKYYGDFIFGDNIQNIGDVNFNVCYSQSTITIYATTPPTLTNSNNFQNKNMIVYVPAESVELYQADPVWGTYTIEAIQ